MGIISRPTKLGGSGSYVAGNDILASEANADAETIYTEFNGGIDVNNIKPTAAIKGTQLASAPNGLSPVNLNTDAVETLKIKDGAVTTPKILDANVTTAKIVDSAVTTIKILDNAVTTTKILDNAVETAKIKDLNVTTAKLNDLAVTTGKVAAASLGTDKHKITIHNVAYSKVHSGGFAGVTPVVPTSPFAKATYDLIGLFFKNFAFSGITSDYVSGDLWAKDSGTNWEAEFHEYLITGGTVTGTAVFIFMQKT